APLRTDRLEHIVALVDTELVQDGGQLFLEDREYPFVDRVLHHQVERSHRVILADPVDTTYALLDTHRVPRQVVVHDDVSELEVDTLASGVSGNENACFGTEVF